MSRAPVNLVRIGSRMQESHSLAFVKHIIPTIGSTLASGDSLVRDDETLL